jgi:hypothetical protein
VLVASALNFVIFSHYFEYLMVGGYLLRKDTPLVCGRTFKFCDANFVTLQ